MEFRKAEGNPRGAGAVSPQVLKNEGKEVSLAQQRAFVGTCGERFYNLWKKGKATQQDYKDAVRLCWEKIRRAKAQLGLGLTTGEKDNKKCFCKYISNKLRASENLHPLLHAGGNSDKG